MPFNIAFNYPAPVAKPRPVKAVISSSMRLELQTNEVSGSMTELLCPVDEAGNLLPEAAPVPDPTQKLFKIFLSDAQLQQIIDIIGTELEAQGVVAAGSTSIITP